MKNRVEERPSAETNFWPFLFCDCFRSWHLKKCTKILERNFTGPYHQIYGCKLAANSREIKLNKMHQYASKPFKNLRSSPFTQFFKLLADKSRDLFQAEKKTIVVKDEQIH